MEVRPVYADCFAIITMAWGAADICGNLRSARGCHRPPHPLPVVTVCRSAVDAHLIIGAIRQLHQPRESVRTTK